MSQSDDKYLDSLKKRYARATRKERSKMLDEYVETTRYSRKYAIAILTQKRKRAKRPIRRPRRTIYTGEDAWALDELSNWFDGINSKRLRVAMNNELEHLYEHGDLQVSPACYEQLRHISPATIDRLRAKWGASASRSPHAWPDQARHVTQEPDSRPHLGGLERRPTGLHRDGLGRA